MNYLSRKGRYSIMEFKETRPFVSWQLMDDFMTAAFVKMGVPEADARLCSDVLLESDRRGIESRSTSTESKQVSSIL